MSSSRRYITLCLVMQFVMLPIVLTVGLFFVAFIGEKLSLQLGRDALRFIYFLLAFAGAFTLGAGLGVYFAKGRQDMQVPEKVRYYTPLLPIIYALVFTFLLLGQGGYQSQWWAAYILKNPILFVFAISLTFSGLSFIVPVAELMGYTGFMTGVVLHDRGALFLQQKRGSSTFKSIALVLCVIAVAASFLAAPDIIRNGLTDLRYGGSISAGELAEYDLFQIAPFKENNGLARLEQAATLQFADMEAMPRLDGATAFYPVYAAFVQEVYTGLGEYYKASRNYDDKDIYTAFVASDQFPFNIVKCSKTGAAYERLINGETDIIFVLEPSKAHAAAILAKGDDFVLTQIASDAFVFFTNINNPVESLTLEQIQAIYAGEVTNWREVGGDSRQILPYQRPENSGSQTIMQNRVMQGKQMMAPNMETFAGGMGQVIHQVAGYKNARNAIGYSFRYYFSEMIGSGQVKYVSIDGVSPTVEMIRSKQYSLTVPIYAVTLASNKDENVKRFIEWVVSPEGQSLVEQTGYVSLN